MTVRAKFKCISISRGLGSRKDDEGKYVECELRTVKLQPVYGNGDPSHENAKFWNATPSGFIELGVINLEAAEGFEIGQEYYVDFSPAA